MIACRDPLGVRPLVMGRLGDSYIFASETVALDVVGATYIRTVEPGEIVIVSDAGRALAPAVRRRPAAALHLRAYLFLEAGQRPRRRLGLRGPQGDRRRSWRARIRSRPIMSCRCRTAGSRPRSATPRRAGIPFELGIIRSHYVGRTFIQPERRGPPPRGQAEAQCQQRAHPGQEAGADRRFDRPRHHLAQDRPDASRGRRARGPYADRLAADPAQLLLRGRTRPSAPNCSPRR